MRLSTLQSHPFICQGGQCLGNMSVVDPPALEVLHLALQIFQAQPDYGFQLQTISQFRKVSVLACHLSRAWEQVQQQASSLLLPSLFCWLDERWGSGAGRRSTVLRALPLNSRWSCSPQAVSAQNIFTLWPRGVIDGVDRLCAFLLLCVPLARAFSASSTIPLLSGSLVDEGWYQRLVTYIFLR